MRQLLQLALAERLHPVGRFEPEHPLLQVRGEQGEVTFAGDVTVGLDPVSLAVRPGTNEVWVANHLSDTLAPCRSRGSS